MNLYNNFDGSELSFIFIIMDHYFEPLCSIRVEHLCSFGSCKAWLGQTQEIHVAL